MRSLLKWSPNKINEKESTRDPAVEVPPMQFSARCANRQGFSGRAETVSAMGCLDNICNSYSLVTIAGKAREPEGFIPHMGHVFSPFREKFERPDT